MTAVVDALYFMLDLDATAFWGKHIRIPSGSECHLSARAPACVPQELIYLSTHGGVVCVSKAARCLRASPWAVPSQLE
eukprot:13232-Eustigmatos_ZCMA.PRE.1